MLCTQRKERSRPLQGLRAQNPPRARVGGVYFGVSVLPHMHCKERGTGGGAAKRTCCRVASNCHHGSLCIVYIDSDSLYRVGPAADRFRKSKNRKQDGRLAISVRLGVVTDENAMQSKYERQKLLVVSIPAPDAVPFMPPRRLLVPSPLHMYSYLTWTSPSWCRGKRVGCMGA